MTEDVTATVDPGTLFSLAGLLYVFLAVIAAVHVLLNKENEGAAVSWLGVILLSPFFGALLYWLFGINRIRRRVRAEHLEFKPESESVAREVDAAVFSEIPPQMHPLMRTGLAIHNERYRRGNEIKPLISGDQAYPEMLDAINIAQASIVMSSYIFEYDLVGREFVDALIAASNRGVLVRVLIDGLGIGYGPSLQRSDRVLKRGGVRTARFLSAFSTRGTRFINLRNHRKILVVDGQTGFVGGINIRAGNLLKTTKKRKATADVHFRVRGSVIDQIQSVFVDDWQFATGELLELPTHSHVRDGHVISRVLIDGPDNNHHKLQLTIVAAINAATRQIRIATPYFVPGRSIIQALQLASLRGVEVQLLVPDRNNLKFVDWAMRANSAGLSKHGISVYRGAEPFDHSKLFIVDDCWCLVGSSNWDARSLELNFEINLECYDVNLATELNAVFADKLDTSVLRKTTRHESLIVRLRNNFFRLFSPYL